MAAITAHRPGDRVKLTLRRGSGTSDVPVTLATQPNQAASG